MICGHTYLLYEASRKWRRCHATSHMYGLITLVIYGNHVTHLVSPSTALLFLTNTSEKR
jgi:hypothetical protein